VTSEIPGTPDFLHATQTSYDAIARPYTERFADWLGDKPLDRALVTSFAELVRANGAEPVADVGSGAGLPGLVLAAARPDLRITLIEPMERRVVWLQDEIGRLGLEQVTVRRARAEEVGDRFEVVTARAVGALQKLLPVVTPLVASGGALALMKGAGVDAEIRAAEGVIRRLRLADLHVEIVGTGMASLETRVLVATVPD